MKRAPNGLLARVLNALYDLPHILAVHYEPPSRTGGVPVVWVVARDDGTEDAARRALKRLSWPLPWTWHVEPRASLSAVPGTRVWP